MTTYETLSNAWEVSTISNNLFEKAVKLLAVNTYTDGGNTTYYFKDGSVLDSDSLNPFEAKYAEFMSADCSLCRDFQAKKDNSLESYWSNSISGCVLKSIKSGDVKIIHC